MSSAVEDVAVDSVVPARVSQGIGRGRPLILAVADVGALASAYALTYVAANAIAPPAVDAPGRLLALLAISAVPIWLAIFTAYGLYDRDTLRISVASFDEVGDVFHALLAGSLAFLLLAQVLRRLADWWIYSALEAALFLTAAIAFVPLLRGAIRTWVFPRVMRKRRALIVGSGPEAQLVHRKLTAHPEYGLDVVGRRGQPSNRTASPGTVVGAAGRDRRG